MVLPSFSTETRPGPAMRPQPVIESTLCFLKSTAIPPGVLLDDFVLAREHRGPVDLDVLHFEAEFLGALEIVVDVRVVQENLGGNAADVQAGAAEEGILLDHGGLQSPLRGADRGDVAARSAADDHEIVFGHTESSPMRALISEPDWRGGLVTER